MKPPLGRDSSVNAACPLAIASPLQKPALRVNLARFLPAQSTTSRCACRVRCTRAARTLAAEAYHTPTLDVRYCVMQHSTKPAEVARACLRANPGESANDTEMQFAPQFTQLQEQLERAGLGS